MCALFLAWRRASAIRTVVAHRYVESRDAHRDYRLIALSLKEWTGAEGGIRLSSDDGPPSREFLDEAEDQEDADDEPLPAHFSLANHSNIISSSPPGSSNGSERTPQRPPYG